MEKTTHYPFNYHEGMHIVKSEPKHKIVFDIKKLFADHQLEEADTIILNMLCKYGYLNAFLIRILLEQNHISCTQSFVTKKLAYLENKGLIIRFQFKYYDEEQTEHFTPFIYEATYKTKKLFLKTITIEPEQEIESILRRISFNQFHIFISKQMAGALKYSAIHFNGKSDGVYRFLSQGRIVTFYVFSQRLAGDWGRAYTNRLISLKEYMQQNCLTCSGIIVICENEMQSLLAEQYRKSIADCNNLPVYYMCDYASVKEGFILSQLIHVKPDNNYSSYDIIKVPVDGNVFYNTTLQKDRILNSEEEKKQNETSTEYNPSDTKKSKNEKNTSTNSQSKK